jgi:PIN domain nuclease of toxin-antitoxin system
VKILLDSHALVWFLLGDRRVPKRVFIDLDRPDTEFVISAVCIWEITTKVRSGRWPEADDVIGLLDQLLLTAAYIPLPITIEHAKIAGSFAWAHRDPFDRLLAAQSQIEVLPLVSADSIFRRFGVMVIW